MNTTLYCSLNHVESSTPFRLLTESLRRMKQPIHKHTATLRYKQFDAQNTNSMVICYGNKYTQRFTWLQRASLILHGAAIFHLQLYVYFILSFFSRLFWFSIRLLAHKHRSWLIRIEQFRHDGWVESRGSIPRLSSIKIKCDREKKKWDRESVCVKQRHFPYKFQCIYTIEIRLIHCLFTHLAY